MIFLGLTASITVSRLSTNSSVFCSILPILTCIRGNFGSLLMMVLPPSNSFFFFSGSLVTVPILGLGIRPLGPRMRAYLASLGII